MRRLLRRLFGGGEPEPKPAGPARNEHSVIVHLRLSDNEFGTTEERDSIHGLTSELERRIDKAAVGEFDGDEFGGGECTLFMYGPDAERLFAAIEEPLRASAHARRGIVIKRYGPIEDSSAREVRIEL